MGFSTVTRYLAIALILSTVSYVGYLHYTQAQLELANEVLTSNNATYQAALEEQRSTMASLEQQVTISRLAVKEAERKISIHQSAAEAKAVELENYRGRLNNAATKKPGLIERRATDATNRLLREFDSAASGDKDSTVETTVQPTP